MNRDPEEITAASVTLGITSSALPMTTTNTESALRHINKLTHYELCWLQRFAPTGHPYFKTGSPEHEAFQKRFEAMGGMTPVMSKVLSHQ